MIKIPLYLLSTEFHTHVGWFSTGTSEPSAVGPRYLGMDPKKPWAISSPLPNTAAAETQENSCKLKYKPMRPCLYRDVLFPPSRDIWVNTQCIKHNGSKIKQETKIPTNTKRIYTQHTHAPKRTLSK